jgi:hypothetical protein
VRSRVARACDRKRRVDAPSKPCTFFLPARLSPTRQSRSRTRTSIWKSAVLEDPGGSSAAAAEAAAAAPLYLAQLVAKLLCTVLPRNVGIHGKDLSKEGRYVRARPPPRARARHTLSLDPSALLPDQPPATPLTGHTTCGSVRQPARIAHSMRMRHRETFISTSHPSRRTHEARISCMPNTDVRSIGAARCRPYSTQFAFAAPTSSWRRRPSR